jgi:hypothetical protein
MEDRENARRLQKAAPWKQPLPDPFSPHFPDVALYLRAPLLPPRATLQRGKQCLIPTTQLATGDGPTAPRPALEDGSGACAPHNPRRPPPVVDDDGIAVDCAQERSRDLDGYARRALYAIQLLHLAYVQCSDRRLCFFFCIAFRQNNIIPPEINLPSHDETEPQPNHPTHRFFQPVRLRTRRKVCARVKATPGRRATGGGPEGEYNRVR